MVQVVVFGLGWEEKWLRLVFSGFRRHSGAAVEWTRVSCRLCLVEVKGTNKLLPSCVTRVEEGMEVTTTSPRLEGYRKMILELLLTERNHICSVCVSNGHCELQWLAQKLEITHVHYSYRYPQEAVDASHDRFVIDHNRCILCTRCVRVCDEIEGAHTWDVLGRG